MWRFYEKWFLRFLTQGLKPSAFATFTARLKSCPDTKRFLKLGRNGLTRTLVLQESIKPAPTSPYLPAELVTQPDFQKAVTRHKATARKPTLTFQPFPALSPRRQRVRPKGEKISHYSRLKYSLFEQKISSQAIYYQWFTNLRNYIVGVIAASPDARG